MDLEEADDFSNDDDDYQKSNLNASELIRLLVQLIKDPDSSVLAHRHLCLLQNYFIASGEKTVIGDLPYISVVLDYFCCLSDEVPVYKSQLYHLLYVLSRPPYLSKMSDSFLCDSILQDYFNILGGLLFKLMAEPFLQKCILSIIHNLLVRDSPEHNSIVNPALCIEGLQKSELCQHLSNFISLHPNDFNTTEMLIVIEDIVTLSETCCMQFLTCNIHDSFLLLLNPKNQNDPRSRSSKERQDAILHILWVLLRCYQLKQNKADLRVTAPSVRGIRNLIYILRYETTRSDQTLDAKFHRNNIAAILLQLVFLFPSMELEQFNVLDDINFYATMLYKSKLTVWGGSVDLTNSEDDYAFKKIMIMTDSWVVIKRPKSHVVKSKTKKLMATLINFLNLWNHSNSVIQWTKIQTRDFLNLTLKMIPLLLPVHADEFIRNYGVERMMDLLELYKYDTIYIEYLQWVVKSLSRVCSFFHKSMKDEDNNLHANKVLENLQEQLIIDLCKRILNTDAMSLAYQQIMTHLLCVLQLLLECKSKSSLDQNCLLELGHSCLNRINNPKEGDSLISNRLQVAVADFVWSFVTYSTENCKKFINKNGIYQILDALQDCQFPIKSVFLSALVDICENPSSIPYMITWHGVKNQKKVGLVSMLCEFWRFQEEWDGCGRDEYGCIIDSEKAFTSQHQFGLFKKMLGTSSPTTLNMLGNVRPKIWAITHFIQERHKAVTDIVQQQYRIDFKANLSTKDEVTFILIGAYYKLKYGEIWQELDGDYLHRRPPHRITPLYRDIIHKLAHRNLHWASYFQTEQKNIVQKNEEKILEEEEHFFTVHNDSQIAPAMKALREICFNARVENRHFLLNAKSKMETQIENCRVKHGITKAISVYPRALNTTTMTAARKPILMHSAKEYQGSFNYFNAAKKSNDSKDSDSLQPSVNTISAVTDYLYTDAVKDESLCGPSLSNTKNVMS